MTSASWVGIAALIIALLTAFVTLSPLRHELEVCRKERLELRRRLEIVTAAIIGTLPFDRRIELLTQLDERVLPADAAWGSSRDAA